MIKGPREQPWVARARRNVPNLPLEVPLMPRIIALGLALILALAAVQPAAADSRQEREVERMMVQFERLFAPMLGAIDARDLVYKRQPGGFHSLSYPLGVAVRSTLKASERPFRTLASGHSASDPANPAAVVTAVLSDLETEYNLWFAVLNAGDEEEARKTTVKLTGPEAFEIEATSDEVVYPSNAVSLIWFNPETPFAATGVYHHRVTVKAGGKVAYRFFAEPASTTTSER